MLRNVVRKFNPADDKASLWYIVSNVEICRIKKRTELGKSEGAKREERRIGEKM